WRAPKSAQAQLSLSFFKLHGVVYGAPRLCAPAIGFVFYTFLYVALLTFLPKILGDGRLGQILPLISLIGTMLTGVAGRYLRTDQLSRVGFLTVIASAVLMMIGLEVAVYPLFFCFGIVPAAQFGMIPELNETQGDRAKAAGAIAQLGNIGTVAGTPVFAVILMMFGANALLWTIVVVSAIGLTAVHLLDRRIRNQ
ncbi:MAG: hypothetical protein ACPGRD_11950, partial [Planktomarina sp.]